MARVNISLPDTLHEAVKAAGVPVSEVCQRALRHELEVRRLEATARESILWDQPSPRRDA
jgi:ATP-dependent Clp protease ATP-binding subunit ClpC